MAKCILERLGLMQSGTKQNDLPAGQFRPWPGSPLFAALDQETAQRFCRLHTVPRLAKRDERPVSAGDQASPLLSIMTGYAFRYSMLPDGGRQVLSLYMPGDTIGIDTLMLGGPAPMVQCATTLVYSTVSQPQASLLLAEFALLPLSCAEHLGRRTGSCRAGLDPHGPVLGRRAGRFHPPGHLRTHEPARPSQQLHFPPVADPAGPGGLGRHDRRAPQPDHERPEGARSSARRRPSSDLHRHARAHPARSAPGSHSDPTPERPPPLNDAP